jgi:hypothetical protein
METTKTESIEIIPDYANLFRMMLRDAKMQANMRTMFARSDDDRAELLREVQRWFAPLTIAANCATTRDAIGELREAMSDMLAALDKEARRLESKLEDADPTDGKGLL